MRSMAGALLMALACAALAVGCGGSAPKYAAAGVTASLAVAAAAVNRAATDECWGQCTHGLICDPEAGVCVEPPEVAPDAPEPEDEDDLGCVQEDDGSWLCPDDPEAFAPPLGSTQPAAGGAQP